MIPPDLSLAELHAAVAVANTGHFGRAAENLRIPQPTLSARIRRVETALSTQLFERTGRRFFITPEGERILPLIRALLADADALTASADSASKRASPLRLGVIPTLGPYLMPHLLLPLRRHEPALALSITERRTARLLESLKDGTIDAAILSLPLKADALASIPLFDEPFRLIAARGSQILSCRSLAPGGMCACDMVLLEEGHCLRQQTLDLCGKRGGTSPRLVTASIETLKYLVAAGEGYSLLPHLACDLPGPLSELLDVREFDEAPPVRRIALCFRRTLARRSDVHRLAEFIRRHPPPGVKVLEPGTRSDTVRPARSPTRVPRPVSRRT